MYSLGVSEEVTGRAIAELARRDEVVIATKVESYAMGPGANMAGLSTKATSSRHARPACGVWVSTRSTCIRSIVSIRMCRLMKHSRP